MFEHTGWTSGAGRVADRTAHPPDRAARLPDRVAPLPDRTAHPPDRAARLPDLAAVDLRTLRVLEDPALVAEVDRVLGRASELGESWFSDEGAE
ncbi:hypothetical protein GCM10010497_02300 [Streptomyces cinereoruber]|uniref:FXSXX-COOH protein n=1 Tax=Streptomyces cinereoruber TaxID=67260 RepID=A0AAV4K953_9ACTN|nr:hypothetical protein [Streptomyces cinereoruber]MBB4158668.1 hypothetical protein [Streptomyces cinereoruber]NIH59329.1 hypothetical protein [Streptomyces cinereoruber]GGR04567.1 hypothetical protein GCM10010497_02300 [Streptomyces cinereoruber]